VPLADAILISSICFSASSILGDIKNERHWSDLVLDKLDDEFVKQQIKASYDLVASKLPKKYGIK